VYWGGPISQDSAVNTGQIRGGFTVAIAGSNGYVTTQIKTPDGYQAGIPYGKYAINAPYDAQGYNTVSHLALIRTKLLAYNIYSSWDLRSLHQPGTQLLALLTVILKLPTTRRLLPRTAPLTKFATFTTLTS
jgi:hypothetical protein